MPFSSFSFSFSFDDDDGEEGDDIGNHLVTSKQKRKDKAITAVSKMGSSVVHGGVSTFLGMAPLGLTKSYYTQLFFKLWTSFILFGMMNALLLLPIALATCGTLKKEKQKNNKVTVQP